MLFVIFAILFLIYYLYATKIEKRSYISRLIQDILVIIPLPNLEKDLNMKNEFPFNLPKNLKTNNNITETKINDMEVLEMNVGKNEIIIYLHGGCYLYNLNKEQILMVDTICSKTNNTVYLPLYPLLPNNSYQDAYNSLILFYKEIIAKVKPTKITIMGDSAGASLCLGLTTIIQGQGLMLPNKLILISPWLDLNLNNPLITKNLRKKDKILDKESLLHAAKLWSNSDDMSNSLLSPINSIINQSIEVVVITGTYDIFYPDIQLLKSNLDFKLIVYDKMLHVFPIFKIPEAKKVIDEIILIINQ